MKKAPRDRVASITRNLRSGVYKTESVLRSIHSGAFAANLITHGARGLARGLAGSLAFAAAAGGRALLECGGRDGFDMFHLYVLLNVS
jgi:hypothetical protein